MQEEMQEFSRGKGYTFDIIQHETRDLWDFRERLKGYDAVISAGEKFASRTMEYLLPELRVISRHGIGTDEIDREFATKNGIAVCNAAGTLSSCVAECALALILNTLHGYAQLDAEVRAGRWGANSEYTGELRGRTVGLLGFGGIARELARFVRAFDCEVLANDPVFDREVAGKLGVNQASLGEICRRSDIISIHVPLMDSTRGMVDMAFLRKMKSTAILINTSRGPVVNEADLYNALAEGVIAGAGLDVFEQEPVDPDNPLLALKNVTLLPHAAARTYEGQQGAGLMACRNAIALLEDRAPESLLNPDYVKYLKG